MRVVITDEHMKILQPVINELKVAEAAFQAASSMMMQAKESVWNKLHNLYPTATRIYYPDGEWSVELED